MRPSFILATGFAFVLAAGAAIVPAYAAQPNGDGVTVLTTTPDAPAAPAQPTGPAVPQLEQAQLDNGDTITAPAGAMIAIQRDAKTGAYTIGVAPAQ